MKRPQPLAAALAALMGSRVWDQVEKKMHCYEGIGRAEGLDIRQQFLLARVVDTYVAVDELRFFRSGDSNRPRMSCLEVGAAPTSAQERPR